MSTSTPNIGLTLPIGVEKVSRAIINANMTKIDTAFGNINRATMREVPFTIAVADWSGSGSSWSATYLTDYVTSTSKEILTYTSSLRTAKAEDISADKKSGGGGIIFTTTKKPIASISGSIYVWDSDDGKIPVIIEGTVTPIENGGTGASSVAGAKNNLGISAVESSVQNLSEHIEKLKGYNIPLYQDATSIVITNGTSAQQIIKNTQDSFNVFDYVDMYFLIQGGHMECKRFNINMQDTYSDGVAKKYKCSFIAGNIDDGNARIVTFVFETDGRYMKNKVVKMSTNFGGFSTNDVILYLTKIVGYKRI